VNCVTPGLTRTELLEQLNEETLKSSLSRMPLGRVGEPEEVAELIAWLSSEACSFSTGAVFDLSGGRATY
jgi:3-oxoacyl-[acyl-carrier protein] reductase